MAKTKHEFIERTIEKFDDLVEEIENRDDRTDFEEFKNVLIEIREELVDLHDDTINLN